jgi:hypothetical protein
MHNARFRLLSGLAGATLFLFAATSYGQNPSTPTTTGTAQTTPQTGTATDATTPPTTTDAATTNATVTRTTATDVTTSTTSFPGGLLGILAVAVLVLLVLFALFRGKDRTVVRETYASSSAAAPGPRNASTGPATDDRMNLNSRAASGPGDTGSGANDPNARR